MRTKLLLAALAATVLAAGHASASVLLSDNFDSDAPPVLNWPGDSVFTSTSPPGSVDLIGAPPPFFDLQPGHGYYVDLDGSTGSNHNPAGQLTSVATLGAGWYKLSFDLAGNLRGAPAQSTTISLGSWSVTLTPSNNTAFTTHTFSFNTSGGHLVFTENGPSDQQGNLLDNVSVSVPEPASWALMLMGFGGLGAGLRARRRGLAAA